MRRRLPFVAFVACAVAGLAPADARGGDPAPAPAAADPAALAVELSSGDLEHRRKAVYALWGLGPATKPALAAVATALRDEDAYVRTTADKILATFRFEKAPGALEAVVPELVPALSDARVEVRRLAAANLWRAGWPSKPPHASLVPALSKALDDEDPRVRATAASVVANLTGWAQDAVPALVRHISDPDPDVRLWCVQGLGATRASDHVEDLVKALQDAEAKVRAAAAAALGFPGPNARLGIPALVKALDDADPSVRAAAAGALAGTSGEAPTTEATEALLRMLGGEDANFRAVAAAALGQVGDPRGVSALEKIARDDPDMMMRTMAVQSLGSLGPEGAGALEAIVAALEESDANLATGACMALYSLGTLAAEAARPLRQATKHADENVRQCALMALRAIGPPSEETRAVFVAALDDPADSVRGQAVVAVGELGSEGGPYANALTASLVPSEADPQGYGPPYTALLSLAKIGPAAKDAAPRVRAFPARGGARVARALVLARIAAAPEDVAESVDLLAGFLAGESPADLMQATSAARALADLGEAARPARPALALLFVTGQPYERLAAADALLAIGGAKAVAAAEYVHARAAEGTLGAAEILAKRLPDDPATREVLVASLASGRPRIRAAAIKALASGPTLPDDLVARLRAARSDPSPAVRQAAVLTLRARGLEER